MSIEQLRAFAQKDADGRPKSLISVLAELKAKADAKPKADLAAIALTQGSGGKVATSINLNAWCEDVKPDTVTTKDNRTLPRTTYTLLCIPRFSEYLDPSRIPIEEAVLDGETLSFKLWVKKPFTPEQKAAHDALCIAKGWGPNNPQAKKASTMVREGEFSIQSGERIRLSLLREPFQYNGVSIQPNCMVTLRGCSAQQSLVKKRDDGEEFPASLTVSNIVPSAIQTVVDVEAMMKTLAKTSLFPDASERNGYGQFNRTAKETAEAQKEETDKDKKALHNWKANKSMLPESERTLVSAKFAIDYDPDEIGQPSVDSLFTEKSLYIRQLNVNADQMVLSRERDGTTSHFRWADIQIEYQVLEAGTPTKRAIACITPKLDEKAGTTGELLAFGLPDLTYWKKIGPIMLKSCNWVMEAHYDLGPSVNMPVNQMLTNPDKEDGTPHMGVHFGGKFSINRLIPNLVSGILRAGRQINLKAAIYFLKAATTSDNLAVNLPQKVKDYLSLNPLNQIAAQNVLNVFLCPIALQDLDSSHFFFLIYQTNTDEETMLAHMTALIENGDDNVDGYSSVVMKENPAQSYKTFPKPNLTTDGAASYVVYAVRKSVVKAWMERPIVTVEQREAEFQRLLKQHIEKAEREEAVKEARAHPVEDTNPSKKQKQGEEDQQNQAQEGATTEHQENGKAVEEKAPEKPQEEQPSQQATLTVDNMF